MKIRYSRDDGGFFVVDYDLCPNQNGDSFQYWVEMARPLGGFCMAMLENDFIEAATRADPMNRQLLREYALFLRSQLRFGCYGSKRAVKEWKGLLPMGFVGEEVEDG